MYCNQISNRMYEFDNMNRFWNKQEMETNYSSF